MRIIIVSTGVLLITLATANCNDEVDTLMLEFRKFNKECLKELNVTKEDEEKFKTDTEYSLFKLRCFSACFMKKSGEIGEDGKPNLKKISQIEYALHNPKRAKKVVELISQCLEEVKTVTDECEFAIAYDDCVDKKTKEIFKHDRIP